MGIEGAPGLKGVISQSAGGMEEASITFGYASRSTHLDGILIKTQGLNYGANFIPICGDDCPFDSEGTHGHHNARCLGSNYFCAMQRRCVRHADESASSLVLHALRHRKICKFREAVNEREDVLQGATENYFSRRHTTIGVGGVAQL